MYHENKVIMRSKYYITNNLLHLENQVIMFLTKQNTKALDQSSWLLVY